MIINVSAKSLIGFKMRKSFKMLVLVLMLGLLVAVVGCSKPSITKITLSGDDSGVVGGTITLTATIEPTDAKGTLTWESSNTAVATVDNNGVVTLLANGETTITVSCGEVSDSKKITVNDAVKRVSVTGPTVVTVGQEATYIATVEPETANQTVLWSSSDSSVLIVDQTGKAQGVAKGSAVISATAGDLTATFDVTVSEGITIKITGETTVNVGETTKLTATIEPAELAAGKDITWSTSDETTATVSPNGVVTGVKKGKVTITATAGEDNASVEVTVNEVLVTGVTVSGETEIPDGKTLQLTATITPENASNKTVAWSSSDEAKATVDDNGLVTAKGAVGDKVTITATVGTVQGSIELTIIAYAAQPKLDLTCEDYNVANYNVGATMQLNSKYGPTLKRGLYWGTLGITYNAELKQYVVTEKLISGDSTSDTLASCDFTLAYHEGYSQYSTINDGVAVGDIIVLPAGLEHQGKQAGANVALKVFAASDVAFLEDVTLPVAYIGDQPYMTLENALAALQEDQTLELMNYEFGAFAIDKQNVTVKSYSGNAKAIVNDKITIAAETNGVTIDSLELVGLGQVYCAGKIDKLTFKNNYAHDITLEPGSFLSDKENPNSKVYYSPNTRLDPNAVLDLYTGDGSDVIGDITVTGNTFTNISTTAVGIDRTTEGKTVLIDGNKFIDYAIFAIRQDGGYNSGTVKITNNEFTINEGKSAPSAIGFRAYSAYSNKHEYIIIENNTFTNIGDDTPEPGEYPGSAVITASTFNDKHVEFTIRFNKFIDCGNVMYLRNNGATATTWKADISYNLFKNISGYIYKAGLTPAQETASDKSSAVSLAVFDGNAFLNEEGVTLTADEIAAKVFHVAQNINNFATEKELDAAIDQMKNPGRFLVGKERYSTLQEALEHVEANGTITVESVEVEIAETITIDKSITIIGPNAATPATAESRESEALLKFGENAIVVIAASNVTIQGMALKGAGELQLFQYKGEVENFTLKNNYFETFNAILKSSEKNVDKIKGKIIYDNNYFNDLGQFFAWVQAEEDAGLTEVQITNNVITNAHSMSVGTMGALKLLGAESTVKVTATHNLFDESNPKNGIFNVVSPNASLTVRFNTFKNMAVNNVISADNKATVNADDNLFLDADGNPITTVEGFPGKVSASKEEMEQAEYIANLTYDAVCDEFLADLNKFSNQKMSKSNFFGGSYVLNNTWETTGIWAFFQSAEYGEKWAFLLEYVQAQRAKAELEELSAATDKVYVRAEFHKLLNKTNEAPKSGDNAYEGSDYSTEEVQQELFTKYHPLTKTAE